MLLARALEVRERAYAPYSGFHVGAAIAATNGKIYTGCNVENASYGLTMCAEMSAVAQMVADGAQEICEALIIGSGQDICTPCGACRQIISEFAVTTIQIHLCNRSGECQTKTIGELLPFSFNSKFLPPT